MNEKLYIPKKINVGYQSRGGTYTGKLGYIIYWDDKGVLRKETSWQGWRDKKIENTVAENVPTEGFVLNKNVGGARSGGYGYSWDARLEKVRVYDPRGFEFEISIPNLLFILQECTSVKGKGLDGEFVYAWAGKELVLIPTCCAEYKTSTEYTALQAKKIEKSEMIVGHSYMTKESDTLIYIGRLFYNFIESYSRNGKVIERLKQHVFYDVKANKFIPCKGFNKIATKISETPVDNYAELAEKFSTGKNGTIATGLIDKPAEIKFHKGNYGSYDNIRAFQKVSDGEYNQVSIHEESDYNKKQRDGDAYVYKFYISKNYDYKFADNTLTKVYNKSYYNNDISKKRYTIEELKALPFCNLYVVLDSGKEIEMEKFLSN